jgi:hypothetical protein
MFPHFLSKLGGIGRCEAVAALVANGIALHLPFEDGLVLILGFRSPWSQNFGDIREQI